MNSEDSKLLELAAKATGYVFLSNGQAYSPEKGNFDWNPLDNDGDAFRLQVRLRMDVDVCFDEDELTVYVLGRPNAGHSVHMTINGDPYAYVRRAIVMVAALVGKEKDEASQA